MAFQLARQQQPYRSAGTRSWIAIATLCLIALVDLIEVVHAARFGGLVDDFVAGTATRSSLVAYDDYSRSVAWIFLAALVACAITFLAWLSRVVENAPAVGAGRPRRGPRAAIGWWFAPFASFVVPYQIVADLSRRLAVAVDQGPGRSLILVWWLTWNLGNLSAYLPRVLQLGDTVDDIKLSVTLGMVTDAANLVAAMLAIAVILRIQGREDARAQLAPPSDGLTAEIPVGSAV